MTQRSISIALILVSLVFAACSSSGSDGGGGGSSSGGSSGSSGGGSSSGGATTGPLSCLFPSGTLLKTGPVCEEYTNAQGSSGTNLQTACNAVGGTMGTKCPSDGLAGCCPAFGETNCYYTSDSVSATQHQADCTNDGHTWQTTP